MSKIKTGGAAFPSGESYSVNGAINQKAPLHQGMTLRDYFAAKAMQAEINEYSGIPTTKQEYLFEIAVNAYAMADAMLKMRDVEIE
jgi:hypothetical protein